MLVKIKKDAPKFIFERLGSHVLYVVAARDGVYEVKDPSEEGETIYIPAEYCIVAGGSEDNYEKFNSGVNRGIVQALIAVRGKLDGLVLVDTYNEQDGFISGICLASRVLRDLLCCKHLDKMKQTPQALYSNAESIIALRTDGESWIFSLKGDAKTL